MPHSPLRSQPWTSGKQGKGTKKGQLVDKEGPTHHPQWHHYHPAWSYRDPSGVLAELCLGDAPSSSLPSPSGARDTGSLGIGHES